MSPFHATMMATGASVTLLGISAVLLLTPADAEEKLAPVSAVVDRDATDQHGLLWTSRRPVLTLAFRVSSEFNHGRRQLLDQDSILAHGQFNLWHDRHMRCHNHPYGERERVKSSAG